MNCRQAQREIALLVGDDMGDEDRRDDVERHLAVCPSCRRHHARMGRALGALSSAEPVATYDSVHSLWPGLRRRLNQPASRASAGSDWKSWAPFAAGVVTCAGLLIAASVSFRTAEHVQPPVSREINPVYPVIRSSLEKLSQEPVPPRAGHRAMRRNGVD